jgi:hypothetical protein
LRNGIRQVQSKKYWSKTEIELDSFNFLMDTSNCKEQPKNQEDVARNKEVKEEEAGSMKWKLKHRQCKVLTLGLDQITKFIYWLDGPLGEGNV